MKFNHLLFCLSLLTTFTAGCRQNAHTSGSYTITGTIDDAAEGDTVTLLWDNEQALVPLEHTTIHNGKFTFTGRQDSTVERIIAYKKNGNRMGSTFFLENGEIQIHLSETSSITGTENNDRYQNFLNRINGIYGQISNTYDENRSFQDSSFHYTEKENADLQEKLSDLDQKANSLILKTIRENIKNPVGFYLFRRYNYLMDSQLQYHLISRLPASWRRTSAIEDIKAQLATLPPDSIE